MPTAAIVLYIDLESYKSDHHDDAELTAEELLRQAGYVNEDAAGLYGYEGYALTMDAEMIQRSDTTWILAQNDPPVAAAATLSKDALVEAANEGRKLGICDEDA